MSVSPTGPQATKPLIVNGDVIEKVDSLKYLGVHLDGRMSMEQHVEKVTRRARGMLHQVRGELQRHNCRLAIHKIYSTCIRPIMAYALAAYYPSTAQLQNRLARVDRTAAHIITNKYVKGTGDQLVEELKWHSIAQLARAERVSQFWQYANNIRRTPGGRNVITEVTLKPHSSRLRARQEENTPDHAKYKVEGVPIFDPSSRYNTPLAIAAQLYNVTPDLVFSGVGTAKRVKGLYLANERGRLVISK